MANGKILRQIADHLSECCQTLEAAIAELALVMSRQDIPDAKTPRELWYETLVILSRNDGILSLLESMRVRWEANASFQSARKLMEDFRSDSQQRKEDVEVSAGMWLTPIGLNEHARKAEVYVGADIANFEKYRELSYALLEIGPAIAAQESDLHLTDKLESLGRLPSEEFFDALVNKPNHPVADVRRVNDLVREQIADMRHTALDSIELKHISASGEALRFEPIRVVLECKLKHTENALETLKMFVQGILDFELESAQFNGSGDEGKRLIERTAAVCFAAQRLVDHLRESLKRRLALANEAIPKFLNPAGAEVSVLLESLRPIHRTGTPAPTLWAKLPQ